MTRSFGVLKRPAAVLLLLCCSVLPAAAQTQRDTEWATSYWLVIFNQPGACAAEPCGPGDLANEATLADVCHLATRSAAAAGALESRFAAGSSYGCLPEFGGVGLIDPFAAELQVLVQDHAADLEAARAWQPSATPEACADCSAARLAVHRPGDADGDGRSVAALPGSGGTVLVREYDGVKLVLQGAEASGPVATVAATGGSADLAMTASNPQLVQTGDTLWTLDKDGELDEQTNVVTWTIEATQMATVAGQLLLSGELWLENLGAAPATIGNIVVNLQMRSGKRWTTLVSNIANATDGDNATSAKIYRKASSEGLSMFSENSASGTLQFMDATNNTVFSLVPQVQIGSGEVRTLLFQASFDNNVLDLAVNTSIRAEVIVSFGNATQGGNSTANVDINGNGTIDGDEDRVRSVPARLGVKVPAPVNGNGTVTLTDTLADIAKSGTVTFSNAQFNLGATSGTVTVTVDGGTDGGTITNCAHLTGTSSTVTAGGFTFPMINGVEETDCSTITVGGTPSCTPGAPGCGWSTGDMRTFSQFGWDASGSALLSSNYGIVYPTGVLDVGIVGPAGFSMSFTSAAAVLAYLPASGTSGSLTNDLSNPTTSASGAFGGNVVALKLNVDFAQANVLAGTTNLGNLLVCDTGTAVDGSTVASILATANTLLGGGSSSTTIAVIDPVTVQLNSAFVLGAPSSWAQTHLFTGSCP